MTILHKLRIVKIIATCIYHCWGMFRSAYCCYCVTENAAL